MTLTLDPQTERELSEAAAARGLAPDALAAQVVAQWTRAKSVNTPEATEATAPDMALEALLDTLPDRRAQRGLGPLSDADLSREALYGRDYEGGQ